MGKKRIIFLVLLITCLVAASIGIINNTEDPPGVGTSTTISYFTC